MNEIHKKYSFAQTRALLLMAIGLLLATAAAMQFNNGAAGDKAWLLFAARKWLEGGKLYVDIFEINPPLILWLYALPAYLYLHCGILQDYHFLVLLGFFTVTLIGYILLQLITLHPEFRSKKKQQQFCLLFALIFIVFQNPTYFFDREYIFLLLTLPYILRWCPSLSNAPVSPRLSFVTGLAAGIGFCIKPHCLLVFAGLNLITLLYERSLRVLKSTENIIIYLIAALYMASIWLFASDYLSTVLPMALVTYSSFNIKSSRWLFLALAFLYFGLTFADFRLRYTSPYRRDIFYLLGVALLLLIYTLVNNGWGYTWNPLFTLGLLITGFVWWEHQYLKKEYEAKGLPTQPFIFGARACAAVFILNVALTFAYIFVLYIPCTNAFTCTSANAIYKYSAIANNGQPIDSFGTISGDFSTWPSYSQATGAKWETRFNHLWMLPKFFQSDAAFAEKNKWILDYVGNAYAQDLKNHKPQFIFVDDQYNLIIIHKYVDLLAFLIPHSPEFAQQWQHYRFIGKVESTDDLQHKTVHHGYFMYQRAN